LVEFYRILILFKLVSAILFKVETYTSLNSFDASQATGISSLRLKLPFTIGLFKLLEATEKLARNLCPPGGSINI
jgi:hypothetical protein